MKRPKREHIVATRLTKEDFDRFKFQCYFEDETSSDLVRQAILAYLDSLEQRRKVLIQNQFESKLKKMEERQAKMQARVMIDVATLAEVLYSRADEETRDQLFADARRAAVRKIQNKRKDGDEEAKGIADDALSGEA